MSPLRSLLLRCLVATFTSLPIVAALPDEGTVIPLWPEGVPIVRHPDLDADGLKAWEKAPAPFLTVFRGAIDRPTGTAMIVAPGGSYTGLSVDREGLQYARWLSTLGVTTFVLQYRVKWFGHPAPLQDVLRSIRIVRSRAAEFGLKPDRIGIIGSSAGGHLAASASTLFDDADGRTGAALDTVSGRPDFTILMYPVIAMDDPVAHANSRKALIGAHPSAALQAKLSMEKQVTAQTPPTLLIHSQDDRAVAVENSIRYYQALTQAGVPADMYLFERGGHGVAMRPSAGTASTWPRRAEEWLRQRGVLEPYKP